MSLLKLTKQEYLELENHADAFLWNSTKKLKRKLDYLGINNDFVDEEEKEDISPIKRRKIIKLLHMDHDENEFNVEYLDEIKKQL